MVSGATDAQPPCHAQSRRASRFQAAHRGATTRRLSSSEINHSAIKYCAVSLIAVPVPP